MAKWFTFTDELLADDLAVIPGLHVGIWVQDYSRGCYVQWLGGDHFGYEDGQKNRVLSFLERLRPRMVARP